MDTQPKILGEICAFLDLHPEVSKRELSTMAKVPYLSLYRLLSAEHRDILSASADRIRAAMKEYEDKQ